MQRIVTILDTALTVNYNDRPISTQKDLDTYKFQFDDSWLGYVKTAVFYTDPAMVKHLLIPEDGVVTIPWEILTGKPQVLYIGVFGAKDNIIKPTTFGAVRLREGSYIDGIAPLPPTPDVYQQIISAWEDAKADEEVRVTNENSRRSNFDALVADYEQFKTEKDTSFDGLVAEYNVLKLALQKEITDGTASVDALQALESQYAAKALALETTYAPQLNLVKSQLAETKTEFQTVIAGSTDGIEVINARGTYGTLKQRLDDSDAKKVPNTRKVAGKALDADIALAKADVGLDKVDNTSDALKPVSIAQAEALGLKVDKTTKVNGKALSGDATIGAVDIAITDLGAYFPIDNIEAALQNAGGRIVKLESKIKIYGVSFSGSNSAGVRTHDALGMVANAGVGDQVVQNDFDKVSFFQRPRCLVYHDATGKARVMAYEGEPGFNLQGAVFAPYIEKAQVFYEQKPFYWNEDLDWPQVSATPLEGFPLAPMFKNPVDKIYLPSYWLGIDNGKACSLSGVHPAYNSINGSMATARTYHARAHLETMNVRISEYVLQLVEFATRDVQTVMTGAMTNRYNADDISILAETAVNRIVMSNASANYYVVGQTICIGTTKNGDNITSKVVITAIEVYDASNKAIIFDGPPINIPLGAFTSTRAWRNGATDIVKASSGSPVSNINGLYPCIWRGKVDPWAMAFSGISDVLIQRLGAGTVEDPYIYNAYQLKDPTLYNNGVIDSNWVKVNYNISGGDGYVTQMGKDPKSPAVRMPTALGGASTTYFASYFYYGRYVVSAVFVGGGWASGRDCSPVYFYLSGAPSISHLLRLARLFVSPS